MSLAANATFVSALILLIGACGSDDRRPFEPGSIPPPSAFVEGGAPVDAAAAPAPTPVDVVITADNAYSFGWGDDKSISSYYENAPARSAREIFECPIGVGPEAYTVPAQEALPGAWLYVVAWADYYTTQGVIGQFKHRGGEPIYTGSGEWQACATGDPYTNNRVGPNQDAVNAAIATCNAGTGDPAKSSAGWVGTGGPITPNAIGAVVFGQDNESDTDTSGAPGTPFPPVCKRDVTHDNQGIDGDARWMWYAPPSVTWDPFLSTGQNDTRTFLVFRLPTKALPEPEPTK